ncbi:hypothetical protein [Rhodococcus sp. T7]|uniref:hypothetical protein n=1 Tax=Rhodococcus sp. T7 TaxID=627444 RepID=UPI001356ABF4|nr:hypothetical protein [Rhodococcus sp. T7]KAF0957365.1 hypothetical protein MLGJGCBP_09196 [Rhodococcus sp. T7]KAF0962164.1 hypothetical protein MLGJGCBP_04786 [Rhodococcus sp. T7]
MTKALRAAITAIFLIVLAGCGTDEDSAQTSDQLSSAPSGSAVVSSAREELDSAQETAEARLDDAKLAAFVVSFRTGYADLSRDRDDEDIEQIAITSCTDIAQGADEQAVKSTIGSLAENNGTRPTPEQTQQIYVLVRPACP